MLDCLGLSEPRMPRHQSEKSWFSQRGSCELMSFGLEFRLCRPGNSRAASRLHLKQFFFFLSPLTSAPSVHTAIASRWYHNPSSALHHTVRHVRGILNVITHGSGEKYYGTVYTRSGSTRLPPSSYRKHQNLNPPARVMTPFGSTRLRMALSRCKFAPYKRSMGVPNSA